MTTKVEKSIEVDVPVHTAYNQWTQFEEFPRFMGGVQSVTQQGDSSLHWVAEIAGVRREWDAQILEQVPDEKVAWAAVSGATNAGAVYFAPAGPERTTVTLHLEYEPEGLVEKAGDALNVVSRQAEADLERFKAFIEERGTATGAWRGGINEDVTVGTPGVEDAALSRGDDGKAGISGKAMAAGAGVAAAVVAGAAAVSGASSDESSSAATVPVAGERDVVDLLISDHREVAALVTQIGTTTDPETRRDMADTVISELVRHSVAEEMYVYPAMRRHLADGEQAVEHDMEEHKQLEATMKQLEGVPGSDPRFDELLRQLETILVDHVSDEETDQFPKLRASVPRAELVELATKVEAAKKLAPTRPHPGAPNSALFHKLVGPGVGLVDRLRDKLSGRSTS
ncbi:MAG TPA: SRPBCC family protein [Intrasporangium sp.]|uniref:SRPBCC family protein n=1 Tax=Intrasporangium sp. TaxID=1925024 RepID=UPI002D78E300|nr:SRPBCC family protein [Intrasporangium sp.]HET7398018.1 SRPBCC family protein [Intrasporangium sp.]